MAEASNRPQGHLDFTRVKLGGVRERLDAMNIRVIGNNVTDDSVLTVWNRTRIEANTKFFNHLTLCTMGAYSYAHMRPFNGLTIGRYCSIAGNVRLFGVNHYTDWIGTSSLFYAPRFTRSDLPLSFEDRNLNSTVIGNDVWIGSDVAIARNVCIGDGAVIASGSIVVRDVPPFAIVAGIPAKVKRFRFDSGMIDRISRIGWWNYDLEDFRGFEPSEPSVFLDRIEAAIQSGRITEMSAAAFEL